MLTVSSPPAGGNDDFSVNITVEFSRDDGGWLARRGDHAWLHGSFHAALEDTAELVAIELGGRR